MEQENKDGFELHMIGQFKDLMKILKIMCDMEDAVASCGQFAAERAQIMRGVQVLENCQQAGAEMEREHYASRPYRIEQKRIEEWRARHSGLN